jgi:NADH-quinone oxidoreductase subunit C
MDTTQIASLLERVAPTLAESLTVGTDGEYRLPVSADQLLEVIAALAEGGVLQHLTTLTGLDDGSTMQVLYHLWLGAGLTLYVACDRQHPALPTVSTLLPVALWYEREVHDLFGIDFVGHPDLSPLLLPEDWEGPPPMRMEPQA